MLHNEYFARFCFVRAAGRPKKNENKHTTQRRQPKMIMNNRLARQVGGFGCELLQLNISITDPRSPRNPPLFVRTWLHAANAQAQQLVAGARTAMLVP